MVAPRRLVPHAQFDQRETALQRSQMRDIRAQECAGCPLAGERVRKRRAIRQAIASRITVERRQDAANGFVAAAPPDRTRSCLAHDLLHPIVGTQPGNPRIDQHPPTPLKQHIDHHVIEEIDHHADDRIASARCGNASENTYCGVEFGQAFEVDLGKFHACLHPCRGPCGDHPICRNGSWRIAVSG
jgi:hypothetical protein